jgi:hypothetical protein
MGKLFKLRPAPVDRTVPYPIRSLPWRKRIYLLRGKLRRWYLVRFRPDYVRRSLARRRGQCEHSGACCQLAYVCPFLGPGDPGVPSCAIYERRHPNCHAFPLDERDLADRDLVMPDHPCGFTFVSAEQARAETAVGAGVAGSCQLSAFSYRREKEKQQG